MRGSSDRGRGAGRGSAPRGRGAHRPRGEHPPRSSFESKGYADKKAPVPARPAAPLNVTTAPLAAAVPELASAPAPASPAIRTPAPKSYLAAINTDKKTSESPSVVSTEPAATSLSIEVPPRTVSAPPKVSPGPTPAVIPAPSKPLSAQLSVDAKEFSPTFSTGSSPLAALSRRSIPQLYPPTQFPAVSRVPYHPMAPPIVVPAAILGPSPDLAAAVDHGLLDEYMHRKKKVLFTVDIDEDADSKKSEPEGSQPTEIEKPEEDVPPPPEDPLAAEVEDLLDLDEDEEEEDEEDEEYEGEDIDGKKVYDLEFLFSKREAGSSAPVGLVLKSDIYSKSAKSEAFYLKWKETFEKQGARASSHRGTRRHESKYGSGRGGGGGGRSKRREDRHAVKDKRPGKQLKIVKRTVPKDEIEILKRKANAILNKLTIDKFESLSKQFFDLVSEACTDCQRAQIIVRLIFDKVVYQKHFADMYTLLCSRFNSRFTEFPMEQIDPETGAVTVKKYSFRHILLSQCQREFVAGIKELTAEDVPDPAEREEKKILQKSRWLGNTIFIGKLYMQNLIHESIIIKCIDILWSNPQDEDYEAVCSLLATVGKKIDASPSENIKKAMTGTFDRIVKTIHENKVIPRIRFALMDLVELRTNMWVPRRMKESAKALSEIHKTSDAKPSTPTSRVDPFANKSFKSTSTAAVAPSSTPGPAPAPSIVETKPASVAQGKFVGKIEEGKLKTAVKEYVESSDKEELKLLFRDLEEKDGFDRQAVRSCFVRMFIEIGVISKTAEYHRILAGTFESLASSEIFSVSEVKSGYSSFNVLVLMLLELRNSLNFWKTLVRMPPRLPSSSLTFYSIYT